MLLKHKAKHVLIIGDLNPTGIQSHFNNLLSIHNIVNHVDFPTHISGSSLDPVISDMGFSRLKCSPLGYVGSSDHTAVLSEISFNRPKAEKFTRRLWKWRSADWGGLSAHFHSTDWDFVLDGCIESQVETFTKIIHEAQVRFVPSSEYEQRTSDQPWFGERCRAAAQAKHQAWRRLKRHPSQNHKLQHRQAARTMQETQEWAIGQWNRDIKQKLQEGTLGSKKWWSIIKNQQGVKQDTIIPPLVSTNGELSLTASSKCQKFAGILFK